MKKLVGVFVVGLIQACSHPIEIVGEGDVGSFDGDRRCTYEEYLGGTDNCLNNLVIHEYHETYFATPRPGWYFHHWENYCTNDKLGDCTFHVTEGVVHNAWGETALPLVAVFAEHHGVIPESRVITVDNREWIQPRLFAGVNWSDAAATCPDGQCSGILLDFDVTGWTWASVEDLNALFNHYIGSDELGTEPSFYLLPGGEWLAPFWDDGWGYSSLSVKDYDQPWTIDNAELALEGMTRDCVEVDSPEGARRVAIGRIWVAPNFYFDGVDYGMYTTDTYMYTPECHETGGHPTGAWFYRDLK